MLDVGIINNFRSNFKTFKLNKLKPACFWSLTYNICNLDIPIHCRNMYLKGMETGEKKLQHPSIQGVNYFIVGERGM